jgi:hypothetical protein
VVQTVTFDDLAGQNQALNGQYPSGVIDWGTGAWYHSGPWGGFTTKSVSFTNSGRTSAPFTFVSPRRLVSVQAYNGGSAATTVTLSCVGQPTKQVSVPVGQVVTIPTDWTGPCSPVTIAAANGWSTNFDNLVIEGGVLALSGSFLAGGDTKPSDVEPVASTKEAHLARAAGMAMSLLGDWSPWFESLPPHEASPAQERGADGACTGSTAVLTGEWPPAPCFDSRALRDLG